MCITLWHCCRYCVRARTFRGNKYTLYISVCHPQSACDFSCVMVYERKCLQYAIHGFHYYLFQFVCFFSVFIFAFAQMNVWTASECATVVQCDSIRSARTWEICLRKCFHVLITIRTIRRCFNHTRATERSVFECRLRFFKIGWFYFFQRRKINSIDSMFIIII